MPKCKKDLFNFVTRGSVLSETKVRQILIQIIDGLSYIHESGWCHRDLKLENIVCTNENFLHVPVVLIGDFGFAVPYSPSNLLSDPVGSIHYCAPEVIKNEPYEGIKADLWSLGVVMYSLLTTGYPFIGRNREEIAAKIISGQYEPCRFLSKKVEDVLKKLLQVDPQKRISLQELKKEPWLRYDECTAMAQPRDQTDNKSIWHMFFGQKSTANDPFNSKYPILLDG